MRPSPKPPPDRYRTIPDLAAAFLEDHSAKNSSNRANGDTRNVIARFEAERQALALMDHPNIAKVLEAGATETGRPFFVMELVRGIKINRQDEARQELADCRETSASASSRELELGDSGQEGSWWDWLIVHALLREAQALIEARPPTAR